MGDRSTFAERLTNPSGVKGLSRKTIMGAGAPIGNQNAKVGREWREALRRAMAHKAGGDYRDTLLQIAAGVVEKALEGEVVAWQEIANREDGKATQVIGGDDEAPLEAKVLVEYVKASGGLPVPPTADR